MSDDMSPVDAAIWLVRRLSVWGARDYAEKRPDDSWWDAVRAILATELNTRQTRQANLDHLSAIKRGTARVSWAKWNRNESAR